MPHHKPLTPAGFVPPERVVTDQFVLRPLRYADAELDYDAWSTSIDHLRGVFGPHSTWPRPDMTLEDNAIDLAWHQREHETKSSFAYTVLERVWGPSSVVSGGPGGGWQGGGNSGRTPLPEFPDNEARRQLVDAQQEKRSPDPLLNPPEAACVGCVYVNPARKVGYDAEVYYWVRASATGLAESLGRFVRRWVDDEWPFTSVVYPGRDTPWEKYLELTDKAHW